MFYCSKFFYFWLCYVYLFFFFIVGMFFFFLREDRCIERVIFFIVIWVNLFYLRIVEELFINIINFVEVNFFLVDIDFLRVNGRFRKKVCFFIVIYRREI